MAELQSIFILCALYSGAVILTLTLNLIRMKKMIGKKNGS